MSTDKIVVPSSKRTIYLEEFNVEFSDDLFDLVYGLQKARESVPATANETVLADLTANYLNERWKENLGGNVIKPGHTLNILRPLMKAVSDLKKNLEDSVM